MPSKPESPDSAVSEPPKKKRASPKPKTLDHVESSGFTAKPIGGGVIVQRKNAADVHFGLSGNNEPYLRIEYGSGRTRDICLTNTPS